MRKYVKDKLLKLIETLEEMNQVLGNIIKKNNISQMIELLGEEQQAAIIIGEKIEDVLGIHNNTVAMLETYCEELWNMSQQKKRNELEHCRKILKKQMREIKISVQQFPEQYQIVFLPYKASMWDCMESVWKAAQKDPDCVCHVVPIPYFDLLPDGSLGKCHYEIDMMPEYVPVVRFEEYQMIEEHPEIIYIHNPYDNMNRVTSVHPDYYSHHLKQYTDKLVYIPYYSLRGNMPSSHSFLPAYYHADAIILQNECMVEDIDPSISREKLFVLGSPKEERMRWMELHKGEMNIPDDWKERLKRKTVFFLNTSITSILNEEEKRVNKIEEVFDVIAKRTDAVLLWRPHPLIDATLQAMRPELEQKFSKLKNRFTKEKLGVLDTTADVERAVALSDAYIGENSSSVIELFHAVYKPRIYLGTRNYYQPTMDELYSESVWDICEGSGAFWFVTERLQLLCKLCIKTGKIDVVASVPEIPGEAGPHYVGIIYYEEQLILVPWRADAICIYDIMNRTFTKYYFRDEYTKYCFGKSIVYGQDLFLVPGDYPAIVRFNLKSKQFFYYEQCIEDVCEGIEKKIQEVRFTKWNINRYGEKIYLVPCGSNKILIFNMRTFGYKIHKVGDSANYVALISDEYYEWLLTDDPKIVRWNKETGEIQEYKLNIQKDATEKIPFLDILDFEDRLYLFPYQGKNIYVFNKVIEEFSTVDFRLPYKESEYNSDYYKSIGRRYMFAKKVSSHEIIAFSNYNRSFVLINVQERESKIFPLRIDNYSFWELRRKQDYSLEVWENGENLLAAYIDYVCNGYPARYYRRGEGKPEIIDEGSIGERIHMTIKYLKTIR